MYLNLIKIAELYPSMHSYQIFYFDAIYRLSENYQEIVTNRLRGVRTPLYYTMTGSGSIMGLSESIYTIVLYMYAILSYIYLRNGVRGMHRLWRIGNSE